MAIDYKREYQRGPFERVLSIFDALPEKFKPSEETPVREIFPGAWPSISDYREFVHAAVARQSEADKLADKIEDLIAEFGDDPKAALQCVSEWLDLRRHERRMARR